MNDVFDALIFYDDLPAEQKEALHEALKADSKLAASFNRWRILQQQIQSSLNSHVPDRELLVLYALSEENSNLLTHSEQKQLENAQHALEAAFEQHPSLRDVIKDIHSAQADFTSLWEDYVEVLETEDKRSDGIPRRSAEDRAPIAPIYRLTGLYRIAAVILLLVLSTTAGILAWRNQNLEIVKTSPGEFRVVELMDGSTVRLFGKSKISYTKHDDRFAENRSIELRGQAFFDIAPNESPFIVETATALTQATGTKFSIEADRSLTKVILTAGQIAVSSKQKGGNNVMLSPGQMSRIPRRKLPTPPETIGDLTDVLSWTGLLVFHDTPLEEVATHLSNYYNVSVNIDPELMGEHWVATYDPDTSSVNEILENLAATLGASVHTTDDTSFLLSR